MPRTTRPPMPRRLKSLIALTVTLLIALVLINIPLTTPTSPQGIVSLQLAANAEQSLSILDSWDSLFWARTSLILDIPFALVYALTLIAVTRYLLSYRPGVRARQTGRLIQTLFIAAGIADWGENTCLLNNLEQPTDTLSMMATGFAFIKFTGLLLGFAGLVVLRSAHRYSSPSASND
ncbi:hypothetical protein ACTXGQ_01945 [Marinobacter sp. 1Y8]